MSAVTLDAPRRLMEFTRPTTITPQQARRWVCRILLEQDTPVEAVDRAAVVVTELVTNAAQHGPMDGVITVSVRRVSAGVEIAVHDQGKIPPEQWDTSGDLDAERGRGLTIVKALSLRFDVEVHRFAGKTVTAVIA